jgi:hypothetical protein
VPLEGHWHRQHTPLRGITRRERRTLAAVAIVLVVVAAGVLYATLQHGSVKPRAGCVDVVGASSTGAATFHACGPEAARWCREQAARHDTFARRVQAECRRQRLG